MSIILPRDKKYHTLESVDRISGLPDSILGVILSLLPTKSAVATSTLSKRWEFVWRTVHNLDFCLEGSRVKQVEGEDEKFVGFVNHVLLHNDAGVLNKFRLVWTPNCIESHATSWIKTAITRNVHELSLTLLDYRNGPFDMPLNVFSCDSLRSLHLDGCICLSAATVFCLPRLESLDLNGVTFQSDEALEKIIRGCPMLNDLRISMYVDENDFRIIISSTSLRRLELNLGFVSDQDLKLEASSLEHLNIYNHGYVSMNFVQKHFSSLVEANFEIYMHYDDDDDFEAGMCDSMVDAVSALDRAKILTLSVDVMRFQMDLDDENDHDHSNWTTPVEVPRCLSTSLKKVVLNGYYGHEDEREMIRYMLKLGSVLEVMQISCDRDVNRKKFESLQEICEFPKKSPACKVKFLW